MFQQTLDKFADYICKQFAVSRADALLILEAINPSANWDVPHLDAAVRLYFD